MVGLPSLFFSIYSASRLFISLPLMCGLDLKVIAKSSTQITKRGPDRGQPCLTPLFHCKNGEEKPLLTVQLLVFL